MSEQYLVQIITFGIVLVIITLLLIKELINIASIKDLFKCEHCNTLNKEISNGCKCINCNRTFRNRKSKWEHYLLFRVSEINTHIKKNKYNYKNYMKLPRIEVVICVVSDIILLIYIISLIIKIG